MLPSGKNQLTLVTKVTNDSKTLQIIQRHQMLVCKHSEGRVNTMQQRQGEEAGTRVERKDEAWRRLGGSVNNRQGSAERSWRVMATQSKRQSKNTKASR